MTDTASAAPTYQQVIASWNAQADEYNQWSELGEDEKIEWAVACAKAAPPAVVEPLTDEQLAAMMRETWGCASIAPRHAIGFARAIEAAHGIGIKGGQHGAE